MKQPVSVFIMDVTNSSAGNWKEMTSYLQQWQKDISSWCKQILPAKVIHRRGDEILFLGASPFSAYTIAYQIGLHWRYNRQKPYFGLSFGTMEDQIEEIDLEIWNHPLIKMARLASEKLKQDKHRQTMYMDTISYDNTRLVQTADLINLLFDHQHVLREKQSPQQRLVGALYMIYQEQKTVAELLNKTPATISAHFKKGNWELLNHTHTQIQKILADQGGGIPQQQLIQQLNQSIRGHLRDHVKPMYPE
ncbi:hypothetical protein J9303_19140 [Bacillaceae bacterium Marseille-Q3522]|nr:hypothetical protein [Bacillaceae bacterium Marseille-Q3522]